MTCVCVRTSNHKLSVCHLSFCPRLNRLEQISLDAAKLVREGGKMLIVVSSYSPKTVKTKHI